MRTMIWMTALTTMLVAAGVESADAQGRSDRARERDRDSRVEERDRDRDDRDDRDRDWERDRQRDRDRDGGIFDRDRDRDRDRGVLGRRGDRRQGNGPPFCRNGRGHPVHGWQWCREKGWDRQGSRGILWERRGWEDVIFRAPTDRRRGVLDQRGLIDVLGDVVMGRLDDRRRYMGEQGSLRGEWRGRGSTSVLDVLVGGVPLARLVDTNADGRVDSVFVAD